MRDDIIHLTYIFTWLRDSMSRLTHMLRWIRDTLTQYTHMLSWVRDSSADLSMHVMVRVSWLKCWAESVLVWVGQLMRSPYATVLKKHIQ